MSDRDNRAGVPQDPTTTRTEKVWLREDGIIHCECLPVEAHDIEDARENVRVSASFTGGIKRPALIDGRRAKSITREARRYYSGEENAKLLTAMAMLIDSPLSRVIGSFFLGLNKTPFPSKLFTNESEAIAWLKQFVPPGG